MCTFTWRTSSADYDASVDQLREAETGSGYDLFFNRDERHQRALETPPDFGETHGVRWLAPRDPDAGGTWILVNAHGVTVCLLNDYATPWRPAGRARSRGQLVLSLAAAPDAEAIAARLAAEDLSALLPFHLIAVAPGCQTRPATARYWHWNGANLAVTALSSPACLSSSSFATAEVVGWRHARFDELLNAHHGAPDVAQLAAWHRRHDPAQPAHSVRMLRADAATRSLTQVTVCRGFAALAYEVFYPKGLARTVETWRLARV